MKTMSKGRSLFAALALVLGLVCAALLFVVTAGAPKRAEAADAKNAFYYSELKNSKLAQRFYHAFEDMDEKGYFVEGNKEYDLLASAVVSTRDLDDYAIDQSPKMQVALGAARDAYYLDHPELFYADIYKLRLTVGMKDGKYVATLGTGLTDNYYADYTVKSAAEVQTAKADFAAAVQKAVTAAKANDADVVQQIKNVNEYLCDNAEYDYGAYDDKHGGIAYNGYVENAYGILNGTEGKALCEGYSTAFKVIMDKLGIPCVLIIGAACDGISVTDSVTGETLDAGYGPHAWNAVEVDGKWYVVDVTWNDSCGDREKYLLVGSESIEKSHLQTPVISSSGFEVKYPAIRPLDYGDNVDRSGFEFKDSGKIGDTEFGYVSDEVLYLGVSYKGKNGLQLKEEDNLYLLVRAGYDSEWVDTNAVDKFWYDNTDEHNVADKYTVYMVSTYAPMLQFAVVDCAPDCDIENFMGTIPLENGGYTSLTSDHILAISAAYENKQSGNRVAPPSVKSMTPYAPGYVMNLYPVDVTITYDEKLVYDDEDAPVDITVTTKNYDMSEMSVAVENVKWNAETNTVSFRFTPSQKYAHNCEPYYFVPTNLIGEQSRLAPEAGRLAFKLEEYICPKVYKDGRLYMKVFGQPQFVSASDESLNSFKDKNGQPIVGNQRSQLMLVVNAPSKAENDKMNELLDVPASDVLASSTYQIDLQMCGKIQKVPTGSYMQVGFGFPAGYGPEDAGVTFTVYHYKRDAAGNITEVEEVPCVIAEYGIVATVKSFSPFMICAVKSDSAAVKNAEKKLLAYVDGEGGKVDKPDIISLASGSSVTYTLNSDAGYKINRVLLNGDDVTDKLDGNTITLAEADLKANNTLVAAFISDRVAKHIADENIELIRHNLVVTEKDMIRAYVPAAAAKAPKDGSNVGMIVGIIIGVLAAAAIACVIVILMLRKKNNGKATTKATAAKDSSNKSTAATKTEQKTAAKPAQTKTATHAAKPSATARPTTTAQTRPTPSARPTTTQNRPTSTNRPTVNQSRPTARPTTTARPTSARPSSGTANKTRPNDKKK